jgi:NAD(P)-dependent dehydrogenase (short-subunit alcohol dehydrogenase family)
MDDTLVTLITGASSGIGRETAIRLSASRRLLLLGRDAGRLDETRRACVSPQQHICLPLDLQRVDLIEPALTDVLRNNGIRVRQFVHCAGLLKVAPLRLVDRHAALESLNVNLLSAVEISRLLVRRKLNEKALAGIVFVSSTASQFGARGFSIYCASKGALDAYMRALAVELAPDVRVNAVLPGAVRTAMTEHMFADPDLMQRMAADYPLGLGEQSDIAGAIEFLLSDNARWITGQQLVVDGGRTVNISG